MDGHRSGWPSATMAWVDTALPTDSMAAGREPAVRWTRSATRQVIAAATGPDGVPPGAHGESLTGGLETAGIIQRRKEWRVTVR